MIAPLLLGAGGAGADETLGEFMERYETALDHGRPELLAHVYEDWTPAKADALRAYFTTTVAEFNVEFSQVVIESLDEAGARIRFLRRDRFTDVRSGTRVEKRIHLTRELRKHDGRWKLRPAGSY